MSRECGPIAVGFPLRGEWCAITTPGYKIPSHGTDQLGQRYAYDFIQIDWSRKGFQNYPQDVPKKRIFGVSLEHHFCWGKTILSPFQGKVLEVKDGWPERDPVNIITDMWAIIKNAFCLKAKNNSDLQPALGNYIILKGEKTFALFAHIRYKSIIISPGQPVAEGTELAQVGHSGNSTCPHLHFQLMDSPNLLTAKGVRCCFKNYSSFQNGKWVAIRNGIPGKRERIKAVVQAGD